MMVGLLRPTENKDMMARGPTSMSDYYATQITGMMVEGTDLDVGLIRHTYHMEMTTGMAEGTDHQNTRRVLRNFESSLKQTFNKSALIRYNKSAFNNLRKVNMNTRLFPKIAVALYITVHRGMCVYTSARARACSFYK